MDTYSYETQHSPNQSSRDSYGYDAIPTGITIHWWGRMGQGHDNVADYLCRHGGNSSAHEVISDGRVTHLVDFDRAAWHAGSTEGNGSTIGLECRPEMTAGDLETLAQRCADIESQLGVSMRYYGHRDWYATACPGDYYDRIEWLVSRVNEIHAGHPSTEEDDMPLTASELDDIQLRAYRGVSDVLADIGLPADVPSHVRDRAANLRGPLGLDDLARAVAEGGDVSAEDIATALAPQLSESMLPTIREAIAEVLGEDNEDQAQAIVDAVAQRLASGEEQQA